MNQKIFLEKIEGLGKWRCRSGAPKNFCAEKHICKFVLSKKKFKQAVAVDLRPIRVQKRDQLWCPKRIEF